MVKIQISSDKKMGKVKTMVLPAKRNSDKTTTKKSNKLALTTESKSYIKKAKSIYWGTPLNIYIPLMKAGYYDPCPAFATFDGLAIDWVKKQKLFVNPPFGKAMDAFCRKCMETFLEAKRLNKPIEILLMIKSVTDTVRFHTYVKPYAKIEFIKKRLKYRDLDNSSKKPVSAGFATIWCIYKYIPSVDSGKPLYSTEYKEKSLLPTCL